jgi:glycine/D-amino acid oxidase-like deaminating enzyme
MDYKQSFDIAIVGQGIAGTLMAHFLESYGKRVLVIDNRFQGSSSLVAAGIVNPVTGKNFVRSWRIHEFLPFAIETYDAIGKKLGIQCYQKSNIIRALDTVEDENNWLARTQDALVGMYMCEKSDISEFEGKINNPFSVGELRETFRVHFERIIKAYKAHWQGNAAYLEEDFDYSKLLIGADGFSYANFSFKEVVFCEGYQAMHNPFFPKIGMAPSKGEVLMVKIPNAHFRKMYKDKVFFVHQYDDIYWVGSGYDWDISSESPTEKAFQTLSKEVDRVLTIPYEIIDHKAAIRPTMHSRRPVFKVHESITNMYLFNGLGTKGGSIGPFAAAQFARYIVQKDPNDLILV